MTLFVVRHGRTTANASGLLLGRADPPLDDTGRLQAQQIASVLPSDATVIASPLQRTRQTAEAVSSDVRFDDRLLELDYGEFDLVPVAQIPAATWDEWRRNPSFAPPGGESLAALADRVGAFLDDIAPLARQGHVVIVTHVSPIKAAVAWALGVGVEVSWRTQVAQASITRIEVSDRGPSLHCFNDVHHLDGPNPGGPS